MRGLKRFTKVRSVRPHRELEKPFGKIKSSASEGTLKATATTKNELKTKAELLKNMLEIEIKKSSEK
jgi:hypothetical protein